jgi:hypothetical protein
MCAFGLCTMVPLKRRSSLKIEQEKRDIPSFPTMADPSSRVTHQPVFEPKTPVANAATVGLKAGAVGFFVSSLQNALQTHNYGVMGVFTRTGSTIGFFGRFFFFLRYFPCVSDFAILFSCHGCNIRFHGIFRSKPKRKERRSQWCNRWMCSWFLGRNQK